jgi:hypothetical protein
MSGDPPEADTYDADRAAALAALAAGDADGAFQQFRWHLWYPRARATPAPRLGDALGVLARILAGLELPAVAAAAERAAADLHDPDALYELGYALIDAGLPPIAATVLGRCLEIVPGSLDVVTELSAALERCLAYADAQALLAAHPALIAQSFLCRYLYAYNAAMAGDLAVSRGQLHDLTPTDDAQILLRDRIAGFVDRAHRVAGVCALDRRDLRGWHYVLTGGVLAHQSPYGFDVPMHGRYAWLQDSLPRVRTGIDRLIATLAVWGVPVPCVYAPPGRDHAILAAAIAQVLGVEVAPWPAVGVPAPGLVALYDLGQLDAKDAERLSARRPGQIVYAHACPWTRDAPIAPELATLLYQTVIPPWGAQVVVDAATHQPRDLAEDDRPVEVIAAELAGAPPLADDDLAADDLPTWSALIAAAGSPAPGRRERLWAGSPVPSSKFE